MPDMSGECVISSVLYHHSKDLKWWSSVTAQLQLSFIDKQRIVHPRGVRADQPKRKEARLNLGSSFYVFCLLPLSLPYVNWASPEGCCLPLRFLLWSLDFLLSIFMGFSFLCLFSHCHFGLLFPILTI